jgi:hypothetical protein
MFVFFCTYLSFHPYVLSANRSIRLVCAPVLSSIHLSFYLISVPIHLFVCPISLCISSLFISLSICLFIHLSFYLYVYSSLFLSMFVSIFPYTISVAIYLSVCLISLTFCLSIHPSFYPSFCQFFST